MYFKNIFIKNFMSVGKEPIKINFEDYNNEDVVIIKGENRDISPLASNGSGKSLIHLAVSFGLFGKTIREMEKTDDYINNSIGKNLAIEIEVDNIKIIRTRKPNKLELWENDNNISLSAMSLTQSLIEEKLGMNYHTFANTCCFGQHNNYSFLSAKKSDKRKIIEDLLQLCEYNKYEENSRRYSRGLKNKMSDLSFQYENNNKNISGRTSQLDGYIQKLKRFKLEIEKEIQTIKSKIIKIESIDIKSEISLWKQYEKAVEDSNEIAKKINELSKKENGIRKLFLDKETELQNKISPIKSEIQRAKKDLVKINNLQEGVKCNSCYQVVDKENYGELKEELGKTLKKLEPSLDKQVKED